MRERERVRAIAKLATHYDKQHGKRCLARGGVGERGRGAVREGRRGVRTQLSSGSSHRLRFDASSAVGVAGHRVRQRRNTILDTQQQQQRSPPAAAAVAAAAATAARAGVAF